MRSTKTPLLVTALASFLLVGCGPEQEDSNQEATPGESEAKVVTPDPNEQPPQPVAKEQPPQPSDAGSAPKQEVPLAKKPDAAEPSDPTPEPNKPPAPPLTNVQPDPAPAPAPQEGALTQQEVEDLTQRAIDGYPKAQYDLGNLYANGGGEVEQDLPQAALWFRKAAEAGNPDAQYNLAMMLDSGHGVEKDAEEAAKWFEEYTRSTSAP